MFEKWKAARKAKDDARKDAEAKERSKAWSDFYNSEMNMFIDGPLVFEFTPEGSFPLDLDAWINRVASSLYEQHEHEYPHGFYWFVADRLAHDGAYDKYLAGEYGGKLYIPDAP